MKTYKLIRKLMIISLVSFMLFSCRTIDLEKAQEVTTTDPSLQQPDTSSFDYMVEEKMKTQDMEDTVFVIEKVVYRPEKPEPDSTPKPEAGVDTVKESYEQALIQPEEYKSGAIIYQYNENQVYEVYTEPYQLTDIVLEPGENVIANPLVSEDEQVWELTAGVGKDAVTGSSIQHLFLKPVYPGLDSTFIVITDRRTYHFRIMSFDDIHMAMVRFKYPNINTDQWSSTALNTYVNGEIVEATNPDLLSFDYKVTYSLFSKPDFLPKRVYDDGKQTYITVDESVLHKELPVLFNEKDELLNYTVKSNIFIIPRLITKVTLNLNGEKVTIEKKKTKN